MAQREVSEKTDQKVGSLRGTGTKGSSLPLQVPREGSGTPLLPAAWAPASFALGKVWFPALAAASLGLMRQLINLSMRPGARDQQSRAPRNVCFAEDPCP